MYSDIKNAVFVKDDDRNLDPQIDFWYQKYAFHSLEITLNMVTLLCLYFCDQNKNWRNVEQKQMRS